MRKPMIVGVLGLLSAVQSAAAQSKVVYTLEIGGDNHADLYEANQTPTFTSGVTSGIIPVMAYDSVTWAVRVSVGGRHAGPIGDSLYPLGAANLVFDLELYDDQGSPVDVGAAPLAADGNQNVAAGPGFWSSINDGDTGGIRGFIYPDLEANAAFAISIHNQEFEPAHRFSLIDSAPGGPNFDYGWYPTANGRSGIDIAGTRPVRHDIAKPALAGRLVGFGAGMMSYDYSSYRPGVGKHYFSPDSNDFGFGAFVDDIDPAYADPLSPPTGVQERPLFEGQISTLGLPFGTYTLKVKPVAWATNVIHGGVVWSSMVPDYGGFGSFAVPANEVYPMPEDNPGMRFEVVGCPCTSVVGRHVFYNQSYFDGNRATIDPAPIAGPRNDDSDAIDPTKSPLMVGGGLATFANWTGYIKGINGLIYDIDSPVRPPMPSDFTFEKIGRTGTSLPGVVVAPTAIGVFDLGNGLTRVTFTFADKSIAATWLQVTIGMGIGLAEPETHFWASVPGDTGNDRPGEPGKPILVSTQDFDRIRTHPTPPGGADVSNPYDINKDGRVSSGDTDPFLQPGFATNPGNAVRMIVR